MKKFYMTMVAMLCGVAAMAENYLYVENIKVEKGTAKVEMPVCLKNSDEITAISFVLQLPEGLALEKNKKGKYFATVDEDRMEDHQVAFTDAGNNQMISVYSLNVETFYENDGPVVYVPLEVAEPDKDATFEVKLYNISVATPAGVSVADAEEFTFTIQVGEGTGIININAADSKAPVYNVAGQRVSKTQKGVYIQNGKKVAVK